MRRTPKKTGQRADPHANRFSVVLFFGWFRISVCVGTCACLRRAKPIALVKAVIYFYGQILR